MHLQLSPEDLAPLVETIVEQVVDRLGEKQRSGRLAYSEAEAAVAMGVQRHVLRDCRLRGEIHARKVGREYRYSVDDLRQFLKEGGAE